MILNLSLLLGATVLAYLFYLAFLVPIFLLFFCIFRRPFKSRINLGRFIFNYVFLVIDLILVTLIFNNVTSDSFIVIGIFICIVLVFGVNLGIGIFFTVKEICS